MAESIITLGIGATPENLTPFITTGLFIGEAAELAARSGYTLLGLQLLTAPDGEMLADLGDAVVCKEDNGPHGFRSLECMVEMPLELAFVYYDLAPAAWLVLSDGGGVVWEGRVEDRAIVTGGLRLVAFGAWRALMDVPYTALWSVSGTAGWRVATGDDAAIRSPENYLMDNNNRLFVGLKKNTAYTVGQQGTWMLQVPHDSSRPIKSVTFDYEFLASSSFDVNHTALNEGFTSGSLQWSLTGTGSLQTGSRCIQMSADRDFVIFEIRCTGATTYAGEDGAHYLKITNLRIVTSLTNRVNTSFTVALMATGSQTVTVSSTARMYVGQDLVIAQGNSSRERVTVTAVNSSTQFTAVFANTHTIGETATGDVIYADEIISDLVDHITAVNPTQLSADTSLIESPGLDLLDESYEDAWPGDIATKLAGLGDDQTPPQRWEVGVWEDRRVHFRPKGSAGRTWFVEVDEAEIESTLETLYNSVYGVYQDANSRTLRTAVADDDDSQARYGIVRRQMVSVSTTSATQAGVHRDVALEDGRVIRPRSGVQFDYLSDRAGAIYPKWLLRAGDTLVLANLPAAASEEIDRVRTFVVAERSYDAVTDDVQPAPETPLTSLEFMVARQDEGL